MSIHTTAFYVLPTEQEAVSHFLVLKKEGVLYNHFEVSFMPIKKIKASPNGTLPRAKDFANPKHLTKDEKESLTAFREAMKGMKEEEAKYGKKTYL